MIFKLAIVLCVFAAKTLADEPRSATAYLLGINVPGINDTVIERIEGRIVFTETDDGLKGSGIIKGMPKGAYGFHVHEVGDVSDCDATLGHFDTRDMRHGALHHEERHVGDLSNVKFESNEEGVVDFIDIAKVLTLRGRNNIVGRALVLHLYEDDLGKGGDEGSWTTGNAGPRVACGVVGILSPIAPWNGAVPLAAPLWTLLVAIFIALSIKL